MTEYICSLLGVARSGYYNYINSEPQRISREKSDLNAKAMIMKTFNRKGYKKGSRSIKMVLDGDYRVIFSRKKYSADNEKV